MTHEYLSTSCWHTEHEYCRSTVATDAEGHSFAKEPAVCKFCQEPCRCWCHELVPRPGKP